MGAILTRTHIILITAHGVYYRVSAVDKLPVNFIEWPENQPHDLLAAEQTPITRMIQLITSFPSGSTKI